MADTPPVIKITERLTNIGTYKKYAVYVLITIAGILLIIGGVSLWKFIFPKPDKQINKPLAWVAPFAKVEKGGISQDNTQVLITEKPWEVGIGGGALRYDNKDGAFLGGWFKRKW